MSLYYLRHGQTAWNKAGTIQGRTDVPLSDVGREQAIEAAKELEGVQFDACYSSPACRAIETAKLALGDRDIPIQLDDRLVEMSYGVFERTHWLGEEYQKGRRMLALRFPGGESYLDVAHRAFSFLDEVKEQAMKGNVLVVCHGAIGRVIQAYFRDDLDNDSFIDNLCPNGGIRVYEYVDRSIPAVIPYPEEH